MPWPGVSTLRSSKRSFWSTNRNQSAPYCWIQSAWLNGIDEIVLSLTARGLTTGEVAAHFEDVYGAKVSKDTISRIAGP